MKDNISKSTKKRRSFYTALVLLFVLLIGSVFLTRPQSVYGFSFETDIKPWITNFFSHPATDTNPQPTNTSWVRDFLATHPEYTEEDIVSRDEYSIHFQRPDGKIEAEILQNPINYKNDQGEWNTLDTAITPSGDAQYDYQNVTNSFKTYFSSDAYQENGNIKLVKGDASLSIKTIDKLTFTDRNETLTLSDLSPKTEAERQARKGVVDTQEQNKICYPKLYEQEGKTMDVCYIVKEGRIQEQLILNKYQGYPELTQTITLTNAYAKKEGKQITFYNTKTNELLWYILDPVIYEMQTKSENRDLHYDLLCNQANTLFNTCSGLSITKILEPKAKDYLADPQRQYPVIIDPDFTGSTVDGYIQGGGSDHIYSIARSMSTSYDSISETLWVGQRLSKVFRDEDWIYSYYVNRGFLKFDTTLIPDAATVTQVNLKLTTSVDNSTTANFDVQIVKQDWSAQDPLSDANREAAYDNCLSGTADDNIWRNTNGIAVNTQYASGNLNTSWISKTGKTYYSLRSSLDYAGTEPALGNQYIELYTQESTTVGYRPVLTVVYSGPSIASLDFTGSTGDGYIQGGMNTSYSTTRSTSSTYDSSSANIYVGQRYQYWAPTESDRYWTYRGFLKFDTSAIPDDAPIEQVTLKMDSSSDYSDMDFDVQIVKQDWSTQDPLSDANREAAYDNCLSGTADSDIWRNTSGMSTGTSYTSGGLSTAWVSKTGNTYYCLRSSRDYSGTNSGSNEYIYLNSQESVTESSRPVLTIAFSTGTPPNTPSLDLPANGATSQSVTPVLKTTATDPESNYLRYKIQICTDSAMTLNCQTFTEPSGASQPGWSGQNAQTNTAYTSGTQAVYTVQTALNFGTTYYWRSYAIDPGVGITWSSTQGTPYSFTTLVSTVPNPPTLDSPADGAISQSITPVLKTTATDPSGTDYLRYKIYICSDSACNTVLQTINQTSSQTGWSGQNAQTNTAYTSGTQAVYTVQSALNWSTTYYWSSIAKDPGNSNTWSTTQVPPHSFTTNTSPNIPTLDSPANAAANVFPNFTFKTTTTDPDNDSLKYKIQVCTDSAMTTGCQLFDQTSSAVGWSGQNTSPVDITDLYADSSKINTGSSTNHQVTGGQLKMLDLTTCPVAGTCQTGGGYAGGNCVAVSNVTVGNDPNNNCTPSYNACSGNNKIGPDGNCDGNGACNTGGQSSACATAGTCQTGGGCSAGNCVSPTNVTAGTDPNNQCNPYDCTSYIGGWSVASPWQCKKAIASSNDGDCNGVGACYTTFADECTIGTTTSYACGTSTGCEYACVVGALATSYDQVAEVCYTSAQHGCTIGTCDASGACTVTMSSQCASVGGYASCNARCAALGLPCYYGYSNSSCTTMWGACTGASSYCYCSNVCVRGVQGQSCTTACNAVGLPCYPVQYSENAKCGGSLWNNDCSYTSQLRDCKCSNTCIGGAQGQSCANACAAIGKTCVIGKTENTYCLGADYGDCSYSYWPRDCVCN